MFVGNQNIKKKEKEQENFYKNKMNIKEAQEKVDKRINELGGYWQELSMLARLTEELGELSRSMNIKYGDKKSKSGSDGREIEKELADVQFTLLAIANKCGVDVDKALVEKMAEDYGIDKKTYVDNN